MLGGCFGFRRWTRLFSEDGTKEKRGASGPPSHWVYECVWGGEFQTCEEEGSTMADYTNLPEQWNLVPHMRIPREFLLILPHKAKKK